MMQRLLVAISVATLLKSGLVRAQNTDVSSTCQQIANAISSASSVYYPPDPNFQSDIYHYATSSTENATCSIEPGTAEDVGIILQILGANKAPFAVKGGGHIMNPGYSSTTGIQISMTRFSTVTYDTSSETAAIGAGLIWDDVYSALQPYNVNVVGGRVSGIGVAGYTLGGGYSWLTNQYGLTLDTVQAYELVLPNGTVTNVTESSNPDLFFGMKGGYNNFGIVTTFTLRTFPQGEVWGGQLTFLNSSVAEVTAATANFSANVTDPKAAIITTYDYTGGLIIASVMMFYDAPSPPAGIFDQFLAIPSISSDVSTRSFLSLVKVEPTQETSNFRGYYNTVPLMDITSNILNAVISQAEYWGGELLDDSGQLLSYDVEPFLPTILTHGGPSAYPWTRSERFLPLNIYFSWSDSGDDNDFYNAIVASAANLTDVAVAEGQSAVPTAPHYPNYAIYSTPLSEIYGTSLSMLTTLKETYDPNDVMSLAGGWKVSM